PRRGARRLRGGDVRRPRSARSPPRRRPESGGSPERGRVHGVAPRGVLRAGRRRSTLARARHDPDARGMGWMTGTPLNSAASARHAATVDLLLEAGADPDAVQRGGWTPLHSAAHNGDPRTVEPLLAHGADPAGI